MPPKTSKDINPFAEIDRLIGRSIEPTGPEWFTTADYASHANISIPQTHTVLAALLKQGKIEKWQGAALGHSGSKRIINKYRLKK